MPKIIQRVYSICPVNPTVDPLAVSRRLDMRDCGRLVFVLLYGIGEYSPIQEVPSSMGHTFCKFISVALVLCVLAVGGLAQAQSAEHAGHHAQHQAATHGTLLCSWMCAAGAVLDTEVVLIRTERNPIALVSIVHSSDFFSEPPRISSSRAPPSSSL